MKIRDITSNSLDFDKCCSGHDPEQYLRNCSHQSDTLGNANADSTLSLITRRVLNKKNILLPITLVKMFLIIFIQIGTFFRNTQKYLESLHFLSEFFIQVNFEMF